MQPLKRSSSPELQSKFALFQRQDRFSPEEAARFDRGCKIRIAAGVMFSLFALLKLWPDAALRGYWSGPALESLNFTLIVLLVGCVIAVPSLVMFRRRRQGRPVYELSELWYRILIYGVIACMVVVAFGSNLLRGWAFERSSFQKELTVVEELRSDSYQTVVGPLILQKEQAFGEHCEVLRQQLTDRRLAAWFYDYSCAKARACFSGQAQTVDRAPPLSIPWDEAVCYAQDGRTVWAVRSNNVVYYIQMK